VAETVTFALAEKIGKGEAHHLVEAASRKTLAEKKDLRKVLAADPRITVQLDV
jgi:3-carboxy-cis,cis-muconate cycloisomerase